MIENNLGSIPHFSELLSSVETCNQISERVVSLLKNLNSDDLTKYAGAEFILNAQDTDQILSVFQIKRSGIEIILEGKSKLSKAQLKLLKKCDTLAQSIICKHHSVNDVKEGEKIFALARTFHGAYLTAQINRKLHDHAIAFNYAEDTGIEEILNRFIEAAHLSFHKDGNAKNVDKQNVCVLEQDLKSELIELRKEKGAGEISLDTLFREYYRKISDPTIFGNSDKLSVFITIVCRVSKDPYLPKPLPKSLSPFFDFLGGVHHQIMGSLGGSKASRDAFRTPEAVLIHLMCFVRSKFECNQNPSFLLEIKQKLKRLYFKRQIDLLAIRQALEEIRDLSCNEPEQVELKLKCEMLLRELPKSDDQLYLTQLHDCIYGRVFDTAFVERLVNKPPPGVGESMTVVGRCIADWLLKLDPKLQEKVTDQMMWYINNKDPRFWFPKTPMLQKMQSSVNWKEAFRVMIEYLQFEKTTGYDIISTPYLIVKISLALDHNKEEVFDPVLPKILEPLPDWTRSDIEKWEKENRACKAINDDLIWLPVPWMRSANANYSKVISSQRSVEYPTPGNSTKAKASGITLLHQPVVARHKWMIPSLRPSNTNRPDLLKPSYSFLTALNHGLPWGVGVSNSTSIMLHVFRHMMDHDADIVLENLILGTMMFLVYDGGHSVHEVLWTANQTNKMLKLGLDLSDCEDPRAFIADYEKFINSLSKKLSFHVNKALERAMDDVIDYFEQNSYSMNT